MAVIEINWGEGWQKTVYKPMDKFSAITIKDRLQSQYKEYNYRVVDYGNGGGVGGMSSCTHTCSSPARAAEISLS